MYKVLLNNANNCELMLLAAWKDYVSNVLCDEKKACAMIHILIDLNL